MRKNYDQLGKKKEFIALKEAVPDQIATYVYIHPAYIRSHSIVNSST
jgi:hypothetical protein